MCQLLHIISCTTVVIALVIQKAFIRFANSSLAIGQL